MINISFPFLKQEINQKYIRQARCIILEMLKLDKKQLNHINMECLRFPVTSILFSEYSTSKGCKNIYFWWFCYWQLLNFFWITFWTKLVLSNFWKRECRMDQKVKNSVRLVSWFTWPGKLKFTLFKEKVNGDLGKPGLILWSLAISMSYKCMWNLIENF